MHRILLRSIAIDVPHEVHQRALAFWTTALAAEARVGDNYPEYQALEHAASTSPVFVQDIGTSAPRYHLDLETDDVAAEVARLCGAGATEVGRHDDWVVLRDPAGLLFCVVPVEAPDFAERSTPVGE